MKYRVRVSVGVPAEVVAKELERIHVECDGLRPKEVVEQSRAADAPLHPAFEWDDAAAGEKWREHQARNLIRSIEVIVEDGGPSRPIYVHVENVYRSVEEVVQSPDMFAMALAELTGKMQSARRALRDLESAARESGDSERLTSIAVALPAVEAAVDAVKAIH